MLEKISVSILGVKDSESFLGELDSLKEKDLGIGAIHVDVMDGEFVENIAPMHTGLMEEFADRGYELEVHLMVGEKSLENEIIKAIKYEAKKIWIHVEIEDAEKYINIINGINRKAEFEYISIGLAINPDTPIQNVAILKDKIDSVLVMSVFPGKGGQKYIEGSYEKIKSIRELLGDIEIVVDGGINEKNIKKVLESGADKVVMGHALTGNIKHMKKKLLWIKKHIV